MSCRPESRESWIDWTAGGATLAALGPVADGRLLGWDPRRVEFLVTEEFDDEEASRAVTLQTDRELMAVGETPSPRFSLRSVSCDADRLVIRAAYTDWSTVSGVQDMLFGGQQVAERTRLMTSWTRSSQSIVSSGIPDRFSHHVCAHGIVLTSDGYLVALRRQQVSTQQGRVSLTFEEQLDVPHVSTRWWPERLARVPGDHGPVDALRRGVEEELGIDGRDASITVLAAAVEDASIAFNVIGLVRVDAPLAVVERYHDRANDRAENRMLSPQSTPRLADIPDLLRTRSATDTPAAGPWHSSSLLRARLAVAHCLGLGALV